MLPAIDHKKVVQFGLRQLVGMMATIVADEKSRTP
jgi:hypothetical protein